MIFSEGNKRYILKHQNDMALEDLARRFHCHWKDVYDCYSDMVANGEQLEYERQEREKKKRREQQRKMFNLMWSRGDKNG